MTLTPDRKRDKRNRRDEPASSAVPVGDEEGNEGEDSPTYRDLLREAGFDLDGHPLADRFDEVASPPPGDFEFADAEHPVEPAEPTESTEFNESTELDEPTELGEPTEAERRARWGGRSLWVSSVDDPEAKAELKRRAAEIDAEKDEWMRR